MDRPPAFLDTMPPSYSEYVDRLAEALGRANRGQPLRSYLGGLALPGERKTIAPIAERLDPIRTSARHQSLHHFMTQSDWDESAVLRVAREEVLSVLAEVGGPSAWAVTLTGQRKKGLSSVGVARQSLGDGGPPANGQLAVTISLAHPLLSLPVAWRLYLPPSWTGPGSLRHSARIPGSIRYRTPGQIALDEIDRLLGEGVPKAPVCAGPILGQIDRFLTGLSKRGLPYLVEISPNRRLVAIEIPSPTEDAASGGTSRSILRIAQALPAASWSTVPWRDAKGLRHWSSFARQRVGLPVSLLRPRNLRGRGDVAYRASAGRN